MKLKTDAPERIVTLALDLGEQIQRYGGEIYRVEDTIQRICTSYGFVRADVFSITSYIALSARTEDGRVFTETRRLYTWGTDLDRLEQLCNLSRYICTNTPSVEEFASLLSTATCRISHPQRQIALGGLLTAGGFCMAYGGTLWDAFASMIAGMIILLMNRYVKKPDTNRIVYTLACSIIAGIGAILIVYMGIGHNIDKVIIGDIMLLIPGMVMVNALRDMLVGDLMAGLMRFIEACLTTIAIACGYAFALFLLEGIL